MNAVARRIGLWGPVVAFMIAVLTVPAGSVDAIHERIWDKAAHTLAFALFGLLCLRAFHGGIRSLALGPTIAALILATGFGAFDEWLQSRTPDRVGSVRDFTADALGVACAVPLYGVAASLIARRQGRVA